MNICRYIRNTGSNLFFPIIEKRSAVTCKISSAVFTVFSSLQSTLEEVYKGATKWSQARGYHSIQSSRSALEQENINLEEEELEEEERIKQMRDYITNGGEIFSKNFSTIQFKALVSWIREHCAEELRARSVISKKGIEILNVETMLPPNWQPPSWLLPIEKLEIVPESVSSNNSKAHQNPYLSLREKLRPIAEYINERPHLLHLLSIVPLATYLLSQDLRIVYAALSLFTSTLIISLKAPLNQKDMQRFHEKALQNPLYNALWKKIKASSSVDMFFAPISRFLPPGVSKNDSSLAHHRFKKGKNEIAIYQGFTDREAFESLIFESINAFQIKRFEDVEKRLSKGKLDKEEYARLTEYVEWETTRLYHEIMDFGKKHLGWLPNVSVAEYQPSFIKNWEYVNVKISHADFYRFQWDQKKFLYYLRYPEKASPEEDWLNKCNNCWPLRLLALNPQIATFWKIDPFVQLIDRGATIDNQLIAFICEEAQDSNCPAEMIPIQVARIKRLLQEGISIPDCLDTKSKAWLKANLNSI